MTDEITPTDTPTDTPAFSIPEAYQGNAAFEGIDSQDTLYAKYAETHEKFADLQAGLPVLPESPDGYEITPPEGMENDPDLTNAFKSWSHEAKIPNEAAQVLAGKFNEYFGAMAEKAAQEEAAAETAGIDGLKKEWGPEFEGKTESANKGLNRFFLEAKIDQEQQTAFTQKFGNDPVAIKLFSAIGSMIGESPAYGPDGKPITNQTPKNSDGSTMLHNYDQPTKK